MIEAYDYFAGLWHNLQSHIDQHGVGSVLFSWPGVAAQLMILGAWGVIHWKARYPYAGFRWFSWGSALAHLSSTLFFGMVLFLLRDAGMFGIGALGFLFVFWCATAVGLLISICIGTVSWMSASLPDTKLSGGLSQ